MKKMRWLLCSAVVIVCSYSMCFADKLTADLVRAKATEAAELLKNQGESAIVKIKDPNGSFRFAEGEGYIWIHNLDGIMIMHPIKPALDGQNILETKDENGTYLFVAMNELAEKYGSGWVPYLWPKPGEKKSSPKISYVVRAGNFVAGCGIYDVTAAEVKTKFPQDTIYEK